MDRFLEALEQFWNGFLSGIADLPAIITGFYSQFDEGRAVFTLVTRWLLPILAIIIFIRCILPLIQYRDQNKTWGYLCSKDGTRMPLRHWENSIGRSKLSDIVINLSFVSRCHAVLTFCEGVWSIADLGSKGGVEVNGKKIEKQERVEAGDTISFAGAEMKLLPADGETASAGLEGPEKKMPLAPKINSGMTLLLILVFQILGGIQLSFSMGDQLNRAVPVTFLLFLIVECVYYLIMRIFSRRYFELELLCYFLCGMDLLIVASAAPSSLLKQFAAILAGMLAYTLLWILLRDLALARKLKYMMVSVALVLLVLNLVIGETRFGAKNWINLGFVTFQPLEFVKVAFVMAGAATLDKLLTARNLTAFIAFSGSCIGALILMRDFGTAVIFFGTFLIIAFMRSGDVRTIAFISAGAVLGAIAVVSFMPYVASRFEAWGHVWEYADTSGYQQTRTMIAAASGGLLGTGGGNGYLINIAAADTDLVFGVICEEWGLLIAITVVLIEAFFAAFSALLTKSCRSSFYAIAACGAASIFLIQTTLNVFGSVDILPLTGVTLPFVSNGGTSMVASWGLLAFIKAADERLRPAKLVGSTGKGRGI
ncbi:MAG TPA: hypothetical protein DD738_10870 [Ruminiclostridium sp.]|nr:hypothetical protein [Ruminiclostridium sp.]